MRAPEPLRVRTATMIHRWEQMTFLHWRYPVDVVAPLVPDRLRVQTFDGSAWIGLLPFVMRRVRPPGVPPLPWLSYFPETNLRTYVTGPDGGSGIFFFSLDATRLPAVLAARASLGLPYFWSGASVRVRGGALVYRGRRRWPGPAGAGYDARVRVGPAIAEPELGPLDHFLTARHRLYSAHAGQLVAVNAEHPPWPLHRARVEHLRQDLTAAAGLPAPDGDPLVHASPGVRVRIGPPELIRR
ncbi:MAG TPA: DUF2071 domain-containing protein [Micromonosporaceae bacterium]|nr:DUF2071 domain-containing protein [Micromonosporaceae bacterium]